jgi:putative oxidoreductase
MNNKLALVARIMFAMPFGAFGMSHLIHAGAMVRMLPIWLPGGEFWIYLTGICLISACFAFVTKIQADKAAFCLVALLLVFVFTLHIPAVRRGTNPQMAIMNLLKDVSLMGGALTYAAIFSSDKRRAS